MKNEILLPQEVFLVHMPSNRAGIETSKRYLLAGEVKENSQYRDHKLFKYIPETEDSISISGSIGTFYIEYEGSNFGHSFYHKENIYIADANNLCIKDDGRMGMERLSGLDEQDYGFAFGDKKSSICVNPSMNCIGCFATDCELYEKKI